MTTHTISADTKALESEHGLRDDNPSSIVFLLGKDCSHLQFTRELIQNSIEAQATQIVVNHDEQVYNATDGNVCALAFMDNGIGLTGDQMFENLMALCPESTDNDGENFGVGAKITAFYVSPKGVRFRSLKGGICYEMFVYLHNGRYIAKDFDGQPYHIVSASEMPEFIQQAGHGTVVTLFGA